MSNDNCTTSLSKLIDMALEPERKFFAPNVFTPNGDGYFELFKIQLQSFENFSIHVLDRWGNLIYYSNDPQFSWDGRLEGQHVSDGVYFYVVNTMTCQGEKIQKMGHVTVVR